MIDDPILTFRRGGLVDLVHLSARATPMKKDAHRQFRLTLEQWKSKICPECKCTLEIIEGHWLLRDCALCAWCRRWFARPSHELDYGSSTRFTTVEVKPNSDREPEKGS
jgi:hypothetical protein